MSERYCPFTSSDCTYECIFNSADFDEGDPENCKILCAVEVIRSFNAFNKTPAEYLRDIEAKLDRIDSNTGSDNTSSSEIVNAIGDIKGLLIKKKS